MAVVRTIEAFGSDLLLFIDGVTVASLVASNGNNLNAQTLLGIGCNMDTGGNYFMGDLDQIRMYDISLSPQELLHIMENGKQNYE